MKRRVNSPLSSAPSPSQASDRRSAGKREVGTSGGDSSGANDSLYKSLEFRVKWQGYDSEKDLTWEPEESLEDVPEIVEQYFRLAGGRQNILTTMLPRGKRAPKRSKRSSAATAAAHTMSGRQLENGAKAVDEDSSTATESWQPPAGSWEDEVDTIDSCERGRGGKLIVYLIWKNGKKTKHETPVVYKKCPCCNFTSDTFELFKRIIFSGSTTRQDAWRLPVEVHSVEYGWGGSGTPLYPQMS
ncbi:chromo (CHRromatin organization MOdifier) domain-containing protein [Pochonia chlamydosporia 170]|uniref:Chromo (CHRromatin organization MOdifier) domain-containing protein n=1 Tax=Pochonia chlamydosporia 170 TaxID=1380566 RepID=A0A179EZA1_METCM|nr:chromo (CHRromatin organization MOdifier) domain-containing protein [Pochonia chlamydosporia 170]OAQ58229.1 chromo (CHRromatin organization MOdifier) domain-containing protein [Pochonia chlamydosporia 170]